MPLLIILLLTALLGCASTLKDFRESNKLEYVTQIPGWHQTFASCVMARFDDTDERVRPDTLRLVSYQNRTSLLFSGDAPAGILTFMLSPQAELVFTQTGKDVLVEHRRRWGFDAKYWLDAAKPFLAPCAHESLPH